MSDASNLTYQDAYNTLVQQIYLPIFFTKLAQTYGIQPSHDEDAKQLLVMADLLRHAETAEMKKTASANTTLFSQATNALTKTLQTVGVIDNSVSDEQVKVASAQICSNQSIKDAAVVYQDYLAQLLASQK